jgi:hypothetical protein
MFVQRSVDDIMDVASSIISLRDLRVRQTEQVRCDVARLHSLLRSETLQELELSNTTFVGTLPPGQLSGAINNRSVKKLSLDGCSLSYQSLQVIFSCSGIESIEFGRIELGEDVPTAATASIVNGLRSLTSYSDVVQDNRFLAFIVPNLLAGPISAKVTIEFCFGRGTFPAVRDLLVCGVSDVSLISLTHEDSAAICEGIRESVGLTNLELSMSGRDRLCMRDILSAVQDNTSLRRFVFDYDIFRGGLRGDVGGELGPAVELFASNTTLDIFGISGTSFGIDTMPADLHNVLFPFVVRGLRFNRRLRTLTTYKHDPEHYSDEDLELVSEQVSSEVVAMLEEHNTTLLRIEDVRYESREHGERIRSLLDLNRHCRDFCSSSEQARPGMDDRESPIEPNFNPVPLDHWGRVLSRISTVACNYFVTKLARQALQGGGDEGSASGGDEDGEHEETKNKQMTLSHPDGHE